MRTRTPLLASALLAVLVGLGLVVFGDDEPDRISSVDATSTTTTAPLASSTSTTSTSTSTPAATTSAPPTAPPATSPPGSAPPPPPPPPPPPAPPPPPPTNPRIATVTAADLGASWRSGCPVGPQDLRRITVTHRGFDGRDHTGHLVVHEDWAEALLGVFDRIHAAGFPIQRIQPVSDFGADDTASMDANNTSAFNCRAVTNGSSWSNHSFGTAIDVNPVQNPYVRGRADGSFDVQPAAGGPFAHDRSARQGVITAGDAVVVAFGSIGWTWGGTWSSLKDYQHFDVR